MDGGFVRPAGFGFQRILISGWNWVILMEIIPFGGETKAGWKGIGKD